MMSKIHMKNMFKIPSVTIPSVPSAPINSFVVSKPAEDLRERRRVLMTSPEGRTTVYTNGFNIKFTISHGYSQRSETIRLLRSHSEQHWLTPKR
jgi:hypothetical protein